MWVTSILSIQKETIVLILLYYFASIISLKIIVLLINCDIEIPHCSSFISNAFTILHYCCCSVAKSCPILCDPMDGSTPGFPALHYLRELIKFMGIESVMLSQPSYPLPLPSPFAFSLSQHQCLFQRVGFSHQWPKYWSFIFSNSSSDEYSGLISFRTDWIDLTVQVTLKSLLQHHNFTSENSGFMCCWSLAWRFLSIPFLACEMSAILW